MILGVLAALVTFSTFAAVYFAAESKDHPTLSSIGSASNKTYTIMSVGVTASGILLFLFARNWLVSTLALPKPFLYLAGVTGLVCYPIAALVPYTGKWRKVIHNVAVFTACTLFLVMGYMIARSYVLPKGIGHLIMFIIALMLYLVYEFRRRFPTPKFIFVQALYIGSFYVIILLATIYGSTP